MTRLLATILGITLLLFSQIGLTKEEKPPFVWEKISTVDLTQKEIVTYSNAFFAEKFVSGRRVVELNDPELGKLVGTVVLMNDDAKVLHAFHGIYGRLILDAKDGRYRMQMTNIVAVDSKGIKAAWGEIESANNYRIQPMAEKVLADFSAELQNYLTNAKKSAEW